jgi:prolyl-tRNA synthetase
LRKVEQIVREEMNAIGCHEILMPSVQPEDIWQESDRWETFGPELLKFKDRHERETCLAPTHEEAITSMMRHELKSYKQLPITFYQIQTKFRDETRPRAGVMRAREFIMKDAYSFHLDMASLEITYQKFYDAYTRIFTRLGLNFRAAQADTGSIGGKVSHEFHVITPAGEDKLAISTESDFCTNVELLPNAQEGDASPDGKGTLTFTRGIEVVHIFQLGDTYSNKFNASVLNEAGQPIIMQMGCYGVGVSRIVAAAIEQCHDDKGIVWPASMTPFDIVLIPINMHKSQRLREECEKLYQTLTQQGFSVLFDDRNERPGVMFADAELIGIPHRLVLSDKSLDNQVVEYKHRTQNEPKDISLDNVVKFLVS